MAGILVIAEHLQGALRDITGEMIGAAVPLKEKLGGPVTVALIAGSDRSLTDGLRLKGVDEVVAVDAGADHFDAELYEEAVLRLGSELKPKAILVGHTVSGMAFAPALAARLGAGFASDVFGLDAADGMLLATRSAYGNKVNLEVEFPGKAAVVMTLRGATFTPPEADADVPVKDISLSLDDLAGRSSHRDYEEAPPADIDISKADFILSVGRGIQDKENLPRFQALADRLGATFGCSRPIVDSGWLPKPHQVGQSGKVAANCRLYVALGISGAVQHLFGMKHVDTIIAINTDPNAPIFTVATYGATVDVFEFADALERNFN